MAMDIYKLKIAAEKAELVDAALTAIDNATAAIQASRKVSDANKTATNADVVLTHADVVTTNADAATATTKASEASVSATNAAASLETIKTHYDTAPKYLAIQNVANMIYTNNKLTKVRYIADTDTDYEVLSYDANGKLIGVAHYINSVLAGNTVLTYDAANKLVTSIYTGV